MNNGKDTLLVIYPLIRLNLLFFFSYKLKLNNLAL